VSVRLSRRACKQVAATLLVLALALAVPAARADLLTLPGSGCGAQQLEQPFRHWADPASYVLVPGGNFEPGDAVWGTTQGAGVASGNEPWLVHDSVDSHSMSLPTGASVTSPATCISLVSPTLRFFAWSSERSATSSLTVEVLFKTTAGVLHSLAFASVPASGGWEPTPLYLLADNALTALGADYQTVAFRFTPHGAANWKIDDVYVDPWSKG
jgi:hypothetical protein